MDCTLKRYEWSSLGIFGDLTFLSGARFSTLEHAFQQADGFSWNAAVPIGVYICKRRYSPKFNREVFMLTNVPGHTWVELHVGNTNRDSDGCILLGQAQVGDSILNSRLAFNEFMGFQQNVDQFTLTIEGYI